MVALPVAPNCLKFRWVGTYQAAKWVNVGHIQFASGTPNSTDLNTIAGSLAGIWNTRIAPQIRTDVALTLTDVVDLTTNIGNYGSSNVGHNGTFAGGTALPANVAVALSWKTPLHYRGGHPRTYLPGVPSTQTTNNQFILGTYQSALQAAGTGIINDINGLTSASTGALTFVMVSYHSHKTMRAQGTPFPITACVVHPRLDSMRRRLGKELP